MRQASESGGAGLRRSPLLTVSEVYEALREIGASKETAKASTETKP